jgi:hypothetical protein
MHLDHIAKHLEKRSQAHGLVYILGAPASEIAVADAEQRLITTFPKQVVDFYGAYNGLSVEKPQIEILPIERVEYLNGNPTYLLHFASVDHVHKVCFDTSHINEAGQWDIVTTSGYRITFTMASFWSNKLWAWIDKQRAIWEGESTHDE